MGVQVKVELERMRDGPVHHQACHLQTKGFSAMPSTVAHDRLPLAGQRWTNMRFCCCTTALKCDLRVFDAECTSSDQHPGAR